MLMLLIFAFQNNLVLMVSVELIVSEVNVL